MLYLNIKYIFVALIYLICACNSAGQSACDAGKVLVNGKAARASYDVKIGDIIELELGKNSLRVKVLNTNEYSKKEDASNMYSVLQ